MAVGKGTGVGVAVGLGVGVGVSVDVGTAVGGGEGAGAGVAEGFSVGKGTCVGVAVGLGVGVGVRVGVDAAVGGGEGTGIDAVGGVSVCSALTMAACTVASRSGVGSGGGWEHAAINATTATHPKTPQPARIATPRINVASIPFDINNRQAILYDGYSVHESGAAVDVLHQLRILQPTPDKLLALDHPERFSQ